MLLSTGEHPTFYTKSASDHKCDKNNNLKAGYFHRDRGGNSHTPYLDTFLINTSKSPTTQSTEVLCRQTGWATKYIDYPTD